MKPRLTREMVDLAGLAAEQTGAGAFLDAAATYVRLAELLPGSADVRTGLALALQSAGRPDEAEAAYRDAIALDSDHAEANCNLGILLAARGRWVDALTVCRHAVTLRPDHPESWHALGAAATARCHLDEAIAAYGRAIALRPAYVEAHNNLGLTLLKAGRPADAVEALRRAVALRPEDALRHANLGAALSAAGNDEGAVSALERAIALESARAPLWHDLGNTLRRLGRIDDALAAYGRAASLAPPTPQSLCDVGAAHLGRRDMDRAEGFFRAALALDADFALAETYLGVHAYDRNDLAEAETRFRRAIALDPQSVDAHFDLSLALLKQGRLEEGFAEFEWRRKKPGFTRLNTDRPAWNGEAIAGKTLVLVDEQGLGDVIQFSRYAALLADRGATVLFAGRPALSRLMRSVPGVTAAIAPGEPLPDFDFHVPVMSVAHYLGTRLDTVPAAIPYVGPDPAASALWKERMAPLPGFKVGLVWGGTPHQRDANGGKIDHRRSCRLADFAPLADLSGLSLVSLQLGEAAAQAGNPPAGMILADVTGAIGDLLDTAAILANLDALVTVDTAIAHLAGALGRPALILSRFDGCWRWLGRDRSPWYPSARLYHQVRPGDWSDPVARLATDLAAMAAIRTGGNPG